MNKVIRVTGCHECPYCRARHICDKMSARTLDFKNTVVNDRVGVAYSNKSLPGNCPLEDYFPIPRASSEEIRKAIAMQIE